MNSYLSPSKVVILLSTQIKVYTHVSICIPNMCVLHDFWICHHFPKQAFTLIWIYSTRSQQVIPLIGTKIPAVIHLQKHSIIMSHTLLSRLCDNKTSFYYLLFQMERIVRPVIEYQPCQKQKQSNQTMPVSKWSELMIKNLPNPLAFYRHQD